MFIKLAVSRDTSGSAALWIGVGLTAIIFAWGYISGAHYNPSVTLAFCVRNIKAFPLSDKGQVGMYFASQYVGAIFGGIMYHTYSLCIQS